MPPISGPIKIRNRTLAAGEVAEVGRDSVELPTDLKPGNYNCKQTYRIKSSSKEDLSLSVSAKIQVEPTPEASEREVKGRQKVGPTLIERNPHLRWDRLQPDNEHARVLRDWGNIPYEKARAAGIRKTSELPEIWEEVPPGSKSYEVRSQLAGTNFNYDLHNWGPSNKKAIKEFEDWLSQAS